MSKKNPSSSSSSNKSSKSDVFTSFKTSSSSNNFESYNSSTNTLNNIKSLSIPPSSSSSSSSSLLKKSKSSSKKKSSPLPDYIKDPVQLKKHLDLLYNRNPIERKSLPSDNYQKPLSKDIIIYDQEPLTRDRIGYDSKVYKWFYVDSTLNSIIYFPDDHIIQKIVPGNLNYNPETKLFYYYDNKYIQHSFYLYPIQQKPPSPVYIFAPQQKPKSPENIFAPQQKSKSKSTSLKQISSSLLFPENIFAPQQKSKSKSKSTSLKQISSSILLSPENKNSPQQKSLISLKKQNISTELPIKIRHDISYLSSDNEKIIHNDNTINICSKWNLIKKKYPTNPFNPITNLKIKVDGPKYKELNKLCENVPINSKIKFKNKKKEEPEINISLCSQWKLNKNKNPKTNRNITKTGKIYKQYEKICRDDLSTSDKQKKSDTNIKLCIKWLKIKKEFPHNLYNPKTNAPIKIDGPIYKKLEKLCDKYNITSDDIYKVKLSKKKKKDTTKKLTEELCLKWNSNKRSTNPITGHLIKKRGNTYNKIKQQCKKILHST